MTARHRAETEARSARRAVARQLHPDVGGDPDAFVAAMQALSEPAGPPAARPLVTVTRRRRLQRRVAAVGALVHDVRRRLPRTWPGSRRYGHL